MKKDTLPLFNQKGEKISEIPLDEQVFDGKVNTALLHQAVRMYQANLRQGTHTTKTRGEVSGGGKKPWRQKGTGRARAGSIRSPLWRHGGVTFGPVIRKYAYTLPRRMKTLALRASLNAKVKEGEVILVDKLQMDSPKTKTFASFLSQLKLNGRLLVVVAQWTKPLKRSHRNIPGICLKTHDQLNAFDLLRYPKVLMEQDAFTKVAGRCRVGTS